MNRELAKKLREALDLLERGDDDVTRLARANSELCDELFEARRQIKELKAELVKLREGKAA